MDDHVHVFVSSFDSHRMVIKKFHCCLLLLRSCWCGLLLHQSGVMCTVMSKKTEVVVVAIRDLLSKIGFLATEAEGRSLNRNDSILLHWFQWIKPDEHFCLIVSSFGANHIQIFNLYCFHGQLCCIQAIFSSAFR